MSQAHITLTIGLIDTLTKKVLNEIVSLNPIRLFLYTSNMPVIFYIKISPLASFGISFPPLLKSVCREIPNQMPFVIKNYTAKSG